MEAVIVVVFVGVAGMVLGMIAGICLDWGSAVKERHDDFQRYKRIGIEETRLEAIKSGVGEYYLDANHNKQFRWKQQKEGQ